MKHAFYFLLSAWAVMTTASVAHAFYDPTVGRFLSMDPIDNNKGESRYTFVDGDPVNFFDPDGREKVIVTYRTFIPQKQVTVGGNIYAGDNRSYSTDSLASSRTYINVIVETDPSVRADPMVSYNNGAGTSSILDAKGNVIQQATATDNLPTATAARDANGNVVVNIQQDTKNPLSPVWQFLTPGIDANLDVTIPKDASSGQVSGAASQFPGEELNVTIPGPGGSTTPLYQFMPPSDASPYSLLLPDQTVDTQPVSLKPQPAQQQPKNKCPN
jgi:hypothetical protein